MSKVWEKAATDDPSTLLVMLALADWANDDGVCWPAIDSIAEKCRISGRTAQRIIKELEDADLLEVTRKRGRTHTNTYRIKVPTCQVLFDLKGANESPIDDEKVTNETEKVTDEVLKGDIAVSPEPSRTIKTRTTIKTRLPKFELPGWVPKQDWLDWEEMRKKKAPMTDRARQLNLNRLIEFQNRGHPASEVLQLAIERGWTGLFEPRGNGNGKQSKLERTLQNFAELESEERSQAASAGHGAAVSGAGTTQGKPSGHR